MRSTCLSAARLGAAALTLTLASSALAQSRFGPTDRWAWQENVGWFNFAHDAGATPGAQSPAIFAGFLGGFVWAENIGWVNLGDGSPANGIAYANTTGADHGVNFDLNTGELSGLAWGENVGWINFGGGALATPPNRARIDFSGRRLRGFAWGENIGWVNLDDATRFVGLRCVSDWNFDGTVDFNDLLEFLNNYNGLAPRADVNGDGVIDFNDLLEFLNLYNTPCP
jgi:hypothetical protein